MELSRNLHAFLWTSPSVNNCNTYLIRADKLILIDPGHAAYFEHVDRQLQALALTTADIDLVIATHAHPDHIEAFRHFADGSTLFALHAVEWQVIREMESYIKATMDIDLDRFAPDFFLQEGDLTIGEVALDVYHTPGHSPGGICIHWPAEKALFSGDLIFKDGLGRTDLPGGSGEKLKHSIRRMAGLDSEWLLPGHGEMVSGADAVKANFDQVERMWFAYI